MFVLLLVLLGTIALGMFYWGMINLQGYDDGIKGQYVNSHRGLSARIYDMGFFSAADRDKREGDNKARNEARVLGRMEK